MIPNWQRLRRSISEFKETIIGFGKTAFTRSGPAFLLPNYQIICIKETAELSAIRQHCSVLSLEKDLPGEPLERSNTSSILRQSQVQNYLRQLSTFGAIVYRSSKRTEEALQNLGGKLLTNPSSIANPFEDKLEFRHSAVSAGLPLLPGETILLNDLSETTYRQWQKQYGERLVFQLTDYKVGGGIGTVFVDTRDDLEAFLSFMQRRREKGKNLQWVNVTPFIEGQAASIIGMVTKEGVLAGPLQLQLIDVPEVTAFYGRNGVFCGHDWRPGRFSSNLQRKAESLARTWGSFIAQRGYKGIFGLDVVVTSGSCPAFSPKNTHKGTPSWGSPDAGHPSQTQIVFPIECNARYTGAFPAYAMLQLEADEPNFDLFQLAEFLKLDYTFNFEEVQRQWRESKTGAQLILHNQTRHWIKINGDLAAGVYEFRNHRLHWLRNGFAMQDIKNGNTEFVLTDGVPMRGRIYKPGERLGRILFKRSIALNHQRLKEQEQEIVKNIYEKYKIEEIENPEEKN